jgi:hypothetical protein
MQDPPGDGPFGTLRASSAGAYNEVGARPPEVRTMKTRASVCRDLGPQARLGRGAAVAVAALVLLISGFAAGSRPLRPLLSIGPAIGSSPQEKPSPSAKKMAALLVEIHREVAEIGRYPGEEFIRREFFIGPGDDDTYKDAHLVVLIQEVGPERKMTLQVTPLIPSPENPRVKFGREVKVVVCRLAAGRVRLERSDYSEKELSALLPEMLRVIRDRKKLFRVP